MKKYFKLFDAHTQYEAYTADTVNFITPNVCYCKDQLDIVHYNPYVEKNVVAKFYVTSASTTRILNTTSAFSSVEVDDVEQPSVTSQYTFSTSGEHTVKYTLVDQTNIGTMAFYNCRNLTDITIPNGVTSIGESAFANCPNLVSCTMPSGITSIGDSAFYDSSGLTNIYIPDSVTSIGSYAFYDCTSLTSINIPSGVTSISDNLFCHCYSLTSCTLPSGITSIGFASFRNCTFTGITIPDSVTSIGASAFTQCTGLTSINIPSGVTSIGDNIFRNCYNLPNINIPNSVTSIGEYAFIGCRGLSSITIQATTPPTLSNVNAFEDTNGCPIYVPSGSIDAYKAANNWSSWGLVSRIQAMP